MGTHFDSETRTFLIFRWGAGEKGVYFNSENNFLLHYILVKFGNIARQITTIFFILSQ